MSDNSGGGGVNFGLARVKAGADEAAIRGKLKEAGARKVMAVNDDGGNGGLIDMMETGDTLTVMSIRDLGRTPKAIADCLAELSQRKADLVAIDDGIDTRKDQSKQAFAAISAFWGACVDRPIARKTERKTRPLSERRHGVLGRPPSKPAEYIAAAVSRLENGESPGKIANELGIATGTLHGWLKQAKKARAKAASASQSEAAHE